MKTMGITVKLDKAGINPETADWEVPSVTKPTARD
jgi:hypothetical protein